MPTLRGGPHPVHVRSFAALDAICHVLTTDPDALDPATELTKAALVELDHTCSRSREDSELSRLETGHSVPVSPLLAEVLGVALGTARRTDGLVDPTVGAGLVDLGHDDELAVLRVRRDQRRAAHERRVPGYWRVRLDEAVAAERVGAQVLVPHGVQLDLGPCARAWAADRAAARCAATLPGGFLVNLGGDLAVAGRGPVGGWQVAVEDSTSVDATQWPVVGVHAGGVATSSTAVRTWRQGDRELRHVVDPRTGSVAEPVWRAVTVTAASAERAAAAAAAAVVLGAAAPRWLAVRGLPARLVSRDGMPVFVGDWPAEDGRRSA